ncbi:MAG: flagellar motor switch protein FliN [Verrucomicrobiia bacterium]|jgi:flagellar motor switch protein FliN/FliY
MSEEVKERLNIDILLDVQVNVSVELGSCRMPMKEVLKLAPGSVITLDRATDAPVDLYVNNKFIGRGEVVVVDNKLGIKILELMDAKQP